MAGKMGRMTLFSVVGVESFISRQFLLDLTFLLGYTNGFVLGDWGSCSPGQGCV